MRSLLHKLVKQLPARAIKVGGKDYLQRYYLGTVLGVQFYIHRFLDSDPDEEVHDHPWRWAVSLILAGHYSEELLDTEKRRHMWPGRLNVITGTKFHRVHFINDGQPDVWTLFFHGKRVKGWGFFNKKTHGYRPFAVDAKDKDTTGWWKDAPHGGKFKEIAHDAKSRPQ